APGTLAPASITGDEAHLFLLAGAAAVGIGANRFETGTLLCRQFDPRVVLLDDGFQHHRLARNVDIVLVDGLDAFPFARLREPESALSRASVIVITRSDHPRPGLEARIRRSNSAAPIFYARVEPQGWVEGAAGREVGLDELPHRVTAFCGLANPDSFWRSLAALRIRPVARLRFPDHSRYHARDLAPLFERADAVLTTEKDWVNIDSPAPRGIYYLKIRVVLDRESEFFAELNRRLDL
ncbi:MAG: tetraacyldisaccharide 4'-kinase, partial [Bryobacteraceae bacterium]